MGNGSQVRLPNLKPKASFGGEGAEPNAAAIRGQLEKILASEAFARAERMSRFLRFIVHETLSGKGAQLKEYLIGVEVFDRDKSYDPRTDPVVRGEARRLRTKLMEYYEREGKGDAVRIHLPKGSYAVVFQSSSDVGPADQTPISVKSTPAGAKSIAVLPFLNLSPNPENEYFSDGLTEEIIHALGRVSGMSVVARTSVFQYKGRAYDVRQIGEQLCVQTVLEGSVRSSGERLRVTAQPAMLTMVIIFGLRPTTGTWSIFLQSRKNSPARYQHSEEILVGSGGVANRAAHSVQFGSVSPVFEGALLPSEANGRRSASWYWVLRTGDRVGSCLCRSLCWPG